jgi:hypothetical protein
MTPPAANPVANPRTLLYSGVIASSLVSPIRRFVVSIVRIGLAETKKFSEGYEAIFGKPKAAAAAPAKATPKKKAAAKPAAKKKAKKK